MAATGRNACRCWPFPSCPQHLLTFACPILLHPAGLGLGAALSMLSVEGANAATELAQIAASDNRVAILGTLFVPALGWVAFNMLQPTLNQFDAMAEKADNANPSASPSKGKRK